MIGDKYWDNRLHRWGAWLATDGGRMSSTPLAKFRQLGVRVQLNGESELPMVHETERETDSMIKALPSRVAVLMDEYYRRQVSVNQLAIAWQLHPDTIRRAIRSSQRRLQRMLSDRRRGHKAPEVGKAVTIPGDQKKGRGRSFASVVPDETIS